MKNFCWLIVSILAVQTVTCSKPHGGDIDDPVSRLKALGLQDVITTGEPINDFDIIRERAANEMKQGAFFVCNLSDVVQKSRNWTHFLPRVTPFFAVKSNHNPIILKVLASLGTGFDCASKLEMEKLINVGVDPSRITLSQTSKFPQDLHFAKATGVKKTTFDSSEELYKIKKFYPEAELLLRISADSNDATNPFGEKFGCNAQLDGPGLIRLAYELGLKMVGIMFHVGTGTKEHSAYERAIQVSRTLFDEAQKIGFNLRVLDIGGGFPGDKNTNLEKVSEVVNAALAKYFPSKDVRIMSEPGRFFVASSMTLATRIVSRRKIVRNGKIEKISYHLNDGLFGSFGQKILLRRTFQPLLVTTYRSELYSSNVWGPTCSSFDKVADNALLPVMENNDLLMFENMGAYSLVLESRFNNMPSPTYEYYISNSHSIDQSMVKNNP